MMSLRSVGIETFIPSLGRWEEATTQKFLHPDDAVFVVRESEKEQYENCGHKVIAYSDSEISNLSKTRQRILDDCQSDMCLQLDDDITALFYRTQEVLVGMDSEDWHNEIIRAFQIIKDLGLGMFSVYQMPSADIRLYNRPFSFIGASGAVIGYYKPNLKARYDEKIDIKQDADFVLQELLLNRIVLIVHYWSVEHETDKNKGGQQVGKNSEKLYRNVEYIKAKWGEKIYDFDFDKNVTKIKVKR